MIRATCRLCNFDDCGGKIAGKSFSFRRREMFTEIDDRNFYLFLCKTKISISSNDSSSSILAAKLTHTFVDTSREILLTSPSNSVYQHRFRYNLLSPPSFETKKS